jgi:uncharacterized repeat protein (TIGR02543 family)
MNGPRAVTANFAADTFVLSTETVGHGNITRNPDQNDFANGSTVELTATADPGWTFVGWSGDLQGTENPQSLIMDGPNRLALFLLRMNTL